MKATAQYINKPSTLLKVPLCLRLFKSTHLRIVCRLPLDGRCDLLRARAHTARQSVYLKFKSASGLDVMRTYPAGRVRTPAGSFSRLVFPLQPAFLKPRRTTLPNLMGSTRDVTGIDFHSSSERSRRAPPETQKAKRILNWTVRSLVPLPEHYNAHSVSRSLSFSYISRRTQRTQDNRISVINLSIGCFIDPVARARERERELL